MKWRTVLSKLFWGCTAVFSVAVLGFLTLWMFSAVLLIGLYR